MIIDCHVHIARQLTGFWRPLRYGKVIDNGAVRQALPPSFDPPASPPEILLGYMDQAGVDKAFCVQHFIWGDQNATILDAIKQWPDRFVGLAALGAMDGPDAPDRLEALINAGMIGLKIELGVTRRLRADFDFAGEREWKVWERLNQLKACLILDLAQATDEDVVALRKVRAEFTQVNILNCHVGWPGNAGWEERALLSQHERGWVDLSSLPGMLGKDDRYPYPKAQEIIRWAVKTFGAGRLLWGSDYPSTLRSGTYLQLRDYIEYACGFLNAEEKRQILGGSAEAFLWACRP